MSFDQIVARLRRALMLERSAFEEIRDDANFTVVGAGLVVVSVLLAALGAFLWGERVFIVTPSGFFVDSVILGTLFMVLLWLAGVALIYAIVSQVYRQPAAPDALFRVCAIGLIPYVVGFLVFVPEIGFGFGIISIVLTFHLTLFGLSAAFNLDQWRALTAALAGLAVPAIIIPLITGPDDSFTTGIFIFGLFD